MISCFSVSNLFEWPPLAKQGHTHRNKSCVFGNFSFLQNHTYGLFPNNFQTKPLSHICPTEKRRYNESDWCGLAILSPICQISVVSFPHMYCVERESVIWFRGREAEEHKVSFTLGYRTYNCPTIPTSRSYITYNVFCFGTI